MSTRVILAVMFGLSAVAMGQHVGKPWVRHVSDGSSRGADGIRLADVNADGRPDIATGWEEGGIVRLYLQPVREKLRAPWPAVTVGHVSSVEDAVPADLDGDGAVDVISSCEGSIRTVYIHWSPREPALYLDPSAWSTHALPASEKRMQWMWCVPMQVDGLRGIDLVTGAKEDGAQVGWFEAPADARKLNQWKWHPLRQAGWIMSIIPVDLDSDGDADLLISDRKGPGRGIYWLERPARVEAEWVFHPVAAAGREAMFMTLGDVDGDEKPEILAAVKPDLVLLLKRAATGWVEESIQLPSTVGHAKAVTFGDIDLDGRGDIVYTAEGATAGRSGVVYLAQRNGKWVAHEISGADGVKYDLAVLLDLDGDGDLDVMTCEETRNLGVIWYENPAR